MVASLMPSASPLLSVRRLKVHYPLRDSGFLPWRSAGVLRAVDGVDFDLRAGEILGIVGESGCGKSSLVRALAGLRPPSAGAVECAGTNLVRLDARGWRAHRRSIQMVFQDAVASLDPRMSIGRAIEAPLIALCPELDRTARARRVAEVLERVGLHASLALRYPHELSGGQCQRVGIGRALVVEPKVLICDEAVSALDVSVQAQIINLLMDLRRDHGLAIIFVAHDLAVVRQLCDRILVMYLGQVVEQASTDELFRRPAHPYTRALLQSIPRIEAVTGADDPLGPGLIGEPPSPLAPPPGCVFASRCPVADERCVRQVPHMRRVGPAAHAACHYLGSAFATA